MSRNYELSPGHLRRLRAVSKQPHPDVVQWIDSVDPESVYLSVITIGEIRKGIEKLEDSKRKETLQAWCRTNCWFASRTGLPCSMPESSWNGGTLMGRLEKREESMPAVDSLIAATALHRHLVLVTRNEDDFLNAGVRLLNPWKK